MPNCRGCIPRLVGGAVRERQYGCKTKTVLGVERRLGSNLAERLAAH
jgi:hypothetical protein